MRFSGAIMAGGRSSRMGTDKAFVRWQGARLLDRQLATMRALAPAEVLLSGRRGIDYAAPGARIVFDRVAGAGPLGGIAAVLAAARCHHLLVLAVDLPAITASFLQQLLDRCGPHHGAAAKLPHGWEPLAAVYPRDILPRLHARLARGEYRLQILLDEAAGAGLVQAVAVTDAAIFQNINTPAEL